MTHISRRTALIGATASLSLAACGNGIGSNGPATIDARTDSTMNFMYNNFPGTRDLASKSTGILVMPLVTEVGLGLGGSFGRGALQIDGSTVDYYSTTSGSAGLQIGAQQYSHVLFFLTQNALQDFRSGQGWAASADITYAINDVGEKLRAETTTSLSPVIAIVFAQAGLRVGATLEGMKYTRIIP